MRRNVEVFINNQRVDLFDFEDINIVDSVQDVRDIAKIFVPYSREFTVPASKNNNKIFKHYYNNDIVNGFDARFKISAVIKINSQIYKKGRITLLGATLKNNRPSKYKMVFYDTTVDLKTVLRDDMMSDIGTSFLSQYNLDYTYDTALLAMKYGYTLVGGALNFTGVIDDIGSPKDLIAPFISSNNYYFLSSNASDISPTEGDTESRNILKDATPPSSAPAGINFKDLRLSLRLPIILQAIEAKYPSIKFAGDFFNQNREDFNRLYLWLNSNKGLYGEGKSIEFSSDDFTYTSGDPDLRPLEVQGASTTPITYETYYSGILNVSVNSPDDDYNIKIKNAYNGELLADRKGTGSASFNFGVKGGATAGITPVEFAFEITEMKSSSLDLNLELRKYVDNPILSDRPTPLGISYYDLFGASTSEKFVIADNMPKIKVIDFLTGLFKMFNLTAYVDEDENIVVDTLDDYYSSGKTVDVTKFVDTETIEVTRNNLYSQIDLEFNEPKTFATINSNEIFNDEFGNERIENVEKDADLGRILAFDGGDYKVAPKFEKMQYERMTDQDDKSLTKIGWGWSVDKKQSAILTAPILHYAENTSLEGESYEIEFDPSTGQEQRVLSQYYRPTNSLSTSIVNGQSLHYGSEFHEYNLDLGENSLSLYNGFWKNTILAIYDERSRITSLKGNLPTSIINTLKLKDVLVINRKKYRINKLDVNITTGDAALELVTYREIINYNGFTVDSDAYTVDSTLITVDKTT